MDEETKYFTLEEAQALLPVLESLLRQAMEARRAAQEIEEQLHALSRKIFLSGGMFIDVEQARKQRAAVNAHLQQTRDSMAEIDAIGVQVKDLNSGLLDFPCLLEGETVLLCWKMGEQRISFWHTLEAGFRGRRPLDDRFTGRTGSKKSDLPN